VLSGNYPNPFNPSTNIYYSLPYNSIVTIQIFDITGKLVKSFKQSNESAGHHSIVWNGKNSNNLDVASGVYMIRFFALSLENNEVFTKSGKMLLTK
jgi:flagellar hook assembly protein FlgD